jgi:hypothetical protein
MKHRHLRQQQRLKTASRNRRSEVDKTADEQPFSSAVNTKKRAAYHMKAEGGRTKHRLDKFRRGGRSRNRYDNGGPAGSSAASTRSADDPGGELATANRERKGTLGRIQDELLGPKSAYARGGRQRSKKYDVGGAATPSGADFISTPTVNPITAFVKSNLPPLSVRSQPRPPVQARSVFPSVSRAPGSKRGGRQQPKRFDDGGVADASPIKPPILALGSGPPAPPQINGDGTPIPSPAPRANDPSFVNRQIAAQKNAQLKQRVKSLEGKGR